MCCTGCAAAAALIVDQGLGDYYRLREAPAPPVDGVSAPDALAVYDDVEVQRAFVRSVSGGAREATLAVEGLSCAACAWLVERTWSREPGVLAAAVNAASHRARLVWDPAQTRLSHLLAAVERLGYRAHPFEADRQELLARRAERAALRRLGVAGLAMVQVMMFAVGLYAGASSGIEPVYRDLLRAVSWLVATVVVSYVAAPFFAGAWRDVRARRPGMDVPIALAIGSAYLASTWASLRGAGEVYFDSICMFAFFLTLARYLELRARLRSSQQLREWAHRIPRTARRVTADGEERVAAHVLRPGDRVAIAPGETIPADGRVCEGESALSEALMTGESMPVARGPGDRVLAGSQNLDGALVVEVERAGSDGAIAALLALLDRAQSEKPPVAEVADRVAGGFVLAVLVGAVGVAGVWGWLAPERAFEVTLSVLVVTCPCALSLATPAALAAATNGLSAAGVLITRGHALEGLASATHFVFDKTGTLTSELPQLRHVVALRSDPDRELLAIAAVLEQTSQHPVARALRAPDVAGRREIDARVAALRVQATDLFVVPNRGVTGRIGGVAGDSSAAAHGGCAFRLGAPDWATASSGAPVPPPPDEKGSWVLLADEAGPRAWFGLRSELRPGARETVRWLREQGLGVMLLSGDPTPGEVARIAGALDIDDARGGVAPEGKLAALTRLQQSGAVVVAVGDGVNDAPLLSRAQVSIAMAGGADLARVSADAVLLGDRMAGLETAVRWGRKTRRVIRQNLGWALVYNATALPLAACGFVAPWAAAIGMSASSLLVVANALRLAEVRES